jgi:hypothetical protein
MPKSPKFNPDDSEPLPERLLVLYTKWKRIDPAVVLWGIGLVTHAFVFRRAAHASKRMQGLISIRKLLDEL